MPCLALQRGRLACLGQRGAVGPAAGQVHVLKPRQQYTGGRGWQHERVSFFHPDIAHALELTAASFPCRGSSSTLPNCGELVQMFASLGCVFVGLVHAGYLAHCCYLLLQLAPHLFNAWLDILDQADRCGSTPCGSVKRLRIATPSVSRSCPASRPSTSSS